MKHPVLYNVCGQMYCSYNKTEIFSTKVIKYFDDSNLCSTNVLPMLQDRYIRYESKWVFL